MFARIALLAALVLATGCAASSRVAALPDSALGQRAWATACEDFDEWDKPGPPFRVYGQTYYVGTCGIASLLVVSPEGHVLIDSGTDKGAELVLANVRSLGFDPRDVKVLLMSHEHFDHVGGMARLQAATGATILTSQDAAESLRSGLPTPRDPQAASGHPASPPVTGPIEILLGDNRQLIGITEFQPIRTPGHTPGALSWSWQQCEGATCKTIIYADSLNPISADGFRFSDNTGYLAAYYAVIATIADSQCDVLLTPHPGSSDMRKRLSNGQLEQTGACWNYGMAVRARLDARLADERKPK